MLRIGKVFSKREFEIIKLIEIGMSSEEIPEKLFLSKHTVNTNVRIVLKNLIFRNNLRRKTLKCSTQPY